MKIVSFNVNGIRAITAKDFISDMQQADYDVICLQETKATVEQVETALTTLGYTYVYANEADRKGYSGTALISKIQPINVSYDIGIAEHDTEGRVICAEYDSVFVVTVYVPNSGSELLRLAYRQQWDKDFLSYLKALEKRKPVVVCGDFNVAHKSIDLKNPKSNYNKSAGYMQQEIDGMDNLINAGFIDSFRAVNGDKEKYSWWSYRAGARQKNVGWRIDYFLISENLSPKLKQAVIHNEILGSDHCPVGLILEL